MSYVKNGSPGKITMDLPRSNYVYELLLFSFGNIHDTVNLSLIYNYHYKCKNIDLFFVKEGFKLNIQKAIRFVNGVPAYFVEANGNCTTLNSDDSYPYVFDDESQRILRQSNISNMPYVIENPDDSKEYYNSLGLITAVVNKYGDYVLRYTYNTSTGRLSSVIFRNDKTIIFNYSGNHISVIGLSGTTGSVRLGYTDNSITVTRHSGEVCNIVLSNTMDLTATNTASTYSTEVKKVDDYSLAIYDYINLEQINVATYKFSDYATSRYSHYMVDITNNEGVKVRNEYWYDHLAYSYEVTGNDVEFLDNKLNGSVQVYRTMDYPYSNSIVTSVAYSSGSPMNFYAINTNGNSSSDQWVSFVDAEENPEARGYYLLTGWYKILENKDPTISIESIEDGFPDDAIITHYHYCPEYKNDDMWHFFAYRIYANAAYIKVHLPSNSTMTTKDFRITFQKSPTDSDTNTSKIATMQYGLVPINNTQKFIPLHECGHFTYVYTPSTGGAPLEHDFATSDITFQDLFKHRINRHKDIYPSEVYYNGCKNVCNLGSSGNFQAHHIVPATQTVTSYVVDNCYLAIRQSTAAGVTVTQIRDNLSSFLIYEMLNESGTVIGYKKLDMYMDVIEENAENVTTYYTREKDLLKEAKVQNPTSTYTRTLSYGSDDSGNQLVTATDEYNNVTVYTLDSTWGKVKSVTLPDGSVVTDTYDEDQCVLTKRTFGNPNGRANSLSYSNGILSSLQACDLNYAFTYSAGMLTNINKNNTSVEAHVHTGNTKTESYYPQQAGALHSTVAHFDKYGRLTSVDGVLTNAYYLRNDYSSEAGTNSWNTNVTNGSALLAESTDEMRGEISRFVYDNKDRLVKKNVVEETDGDSISTEIYGYDSIDRVTDHSISYTNTNFSTINEKIGYTKTADNPAANNEVETYDFMLGSSFKASTKNVFDTYHRLTQKDIRIGSKKFTKQFTYNIGRVDQIKDTVGNTDIENHSYGYDEMGRITTAAATGGNCAYYTYDQYGQLVQEDNMALDRTFVYQYNDNGNIVNAYAYNYTQEGTPSGTPLTDDAFGYSTTYPDRLTSFNNTTIAYNAMGCPTSYDGKSATWTKGKLSSLSSGTLASGTSNYTYTYNAFGQRVARNYSYLAGTSGLTQLQTGQVTSYSKKYYYDHAGRLLAETSVKNRYNETALAEQIVYLYDESSIVGMEYTTGGTSKLYYFQRNLQGDVTALYDTDGALVAKYLYDAWGNCTISGETTNTAVANANPIRYRGYYFDSDTGLCYCNARYYSPKWRRFISPDDTAYLDPESVNGLNLYCYCNNDPVNYKDPTGKLLISSLFIAAVIGGAIAGAAINTASYLYTNEDPTLGGVLGAFAIGALVGGFGGAAGATTGWWSIGFMAAAGVTSGVYTGITTDGTIGQKILTGLTAAVFAGAGAYLGSLISFSGLSFGYALAGNAIFGMTIGGYLEIPNMAIQGWVGKGFQNRASIMSSAYSIRNNQSTDTIPAFA